MWVLSSECLLQELASQKNGSKCIIRTCPHLSMNVASLIRIVAGCDYLWSGMGQASFKNKCPKSSCLNDCFMGNSSSNGSFMYMQSLVWRPGQVEASRDLQGIGEKKKKLTFVPSNGQPSRAWSSQNLASRLLSCSMKFFLHRNLERRL